MAPASPRAVPPQPVYRHPAAPTKLKETGLSQDLLTQLVLKHLHFGADYFGQDIARRLGLTFSAIEPVLQFLKQTGQCEIFGGSPIGGPSYQYRITDTGRRRALLFLEQSHYIGAAPVPLAQYKAYMKAFQQQDTHTATRDRVRATFSHLVLEPDMLDQIGMAVSSGHSMFVYGPPGNGKTVIAQTMRTLLEGDFAVPRAIEVDGQIIKVFDPVNHSEVPSPDTSSELLRSALPDGRWVRCKRPLVTVGGELTLSALSLTHSDIAGYYSAPIQMLANGGVLVIDDFGRQTVSPRELLNRWIVPLESRVDHLTLNTGFKFDVPFQCLVVFATNMKPSELVDEAFLRRVRHKILAKSPTVDAFRQIFERYCGDHGVTFEADTVDRLVSGYLRPRGIHLRGCQPRDLIEQAMARAAYIGAPRHITTELLESACRSYFVDEHEPAEY